MKLSELMRAGAKGMPQTRNKFFRYVDGDSETIESACALGLCALATGVYPAQVEYGGRVARRAILEATDIDLDTDLIAPDKVPDVLERVFQLSTRNETDAIVIERAIMALNDDCLWSADQIADWLESVGL